MIVSGAGKPNLITAEMIKPEVVILDFGFSKVGDKICGDASVEAIQKASFATPTPGGTGPIVVAAVIHNALRLMLQ